MLKLNKQLAKQEMKREVIKEQITILRDQLDSQSELIRLIREQVEEIKIEKFRAEQKKKDEVLTEKEEREIMKGKRLRAAIGRTLREPEDAIPLS